MDEPPAKRAKRADSAAMWEKNESSGPRRTRIHDDTQEMKHRGGERGARNEAPEKRKDDRRPRSVSRERQDRRRDRSRSKERSNRDRERDTGREGDRATRDSRTDKDRADYSRRVRDRSRSRERHRGLKDHVPSRSDYARRRSRSPARNGATTSTRTRSPPRGPRTDRDRQPQQGREKDAAKDAPTSKSATQEPDAMQVDMKAGTNGVGAPEEDEEDSLLRKMMGFSTFKSTQNTKVPGNDVYGVRKEKKTEYRQYMNRVGGFNRPLSPSR